MVLDLGFMQCFKSQTIYMSEFQLLLAMYYVYNQMVLELEFMQFLTIYNYHKLKIRSFAD